jgi:hypothetical protein
VKAATVFFNIDRALGTLLRVFQDPILYFQVFLLNFGPLDKHCTWDRIVGSVIAFEAKKVTTRATNRFEIGALGEQKAIQFNCVLTIGTWTPFQESIVQHKAICYHVLVLLRDVHSIFDD